MSLDVHHPSKDIKYADSKILDEKLIAYCITGSVAAYMAPEIARRLMRHGAEVIPVMSADAQKLISLELMRWATGNPAVCTLTGELEHVALTSGKSRVNLVLIAPATANTLCKLAHGIADTPVTALAMAAMGSGIPILVAPAMHYSMYTSAAVQECLSRLRALGVEIVDPMVSEAKAKMANVEEILARVTRTLHPKADMKGLRIVVTAGATVERLDPIRVLTNLSSGKMGIAIATSAYYRGADVKLVMGHGTAQPPSFIRCSKVLTTEDMFNAVVAELKDGVDVFVSTAAVTDYMPERSFESKIKSKLVESFEVKLVRTRKILPMVKRFSPKTVVVGFKAEYGVDDVTLVESAKEYLEFADVVYANDVGREGVGFGSDTTAGIILRRDGKMDEIKLVKKLDAAELILDAAMFMLRYV
ncbi:MAG: bifunctional phosphopantothenoylcysteine decarboxylase/phosphopantothenate--cysteine ligase CoaBC [Nitrososphaerota archaeon]